MLGAGQQCESRWRTGQLVNLLSTLAVNAEMAGVEFMITVLGILGGAVLGTRYKVLCLVPTIATGIAAIAASDLISDVPASSTVQTALALAFGLQIGYLVGVTVRAVFVAALARRPGPLHEQPARIF
jgi:hypothetical protein